MAFTPHAPSLTQLNHARSMSELTTGGGKH